MWLAGTNRLHAQRQGQLACGRWLDLTEPSAPLPRCAQCCSVLGIGRGIGTPANERRAS